MLPLCEGRQVREVLCSRRVKGGSLWRNFATEGCREAAKEGSLLPLCEGRQVSEAFCTHCLKRGRLGKYFAPGV